MQLGKCFRYSLRRYNHSGTPQYTTIFYTQFTLLGEVNRPQTNTFAYAFASWVNAKNIHSCTFSMVKRTKHAVQCVVPGGQLVIRLAEIVVHNRENTRKHYNWYEIDRQKKAWSFLLMVIK